MQQLEPFFEQVFVCIDLDNLFCAQDICPHPQFRNPFQRLFSALSFENPHGLSGHLADREVMSHETIV